MKNYLIVDGRLAWPAVSLVLFLCVAALGFDFIWRTLVISGEALLIWAALTVLAGCAIIAVLTFLARAPRR